MSQACPVDLPPEPLKDMNWVLTVNCYESLLHGSYAQGLSKRAAPGVDAIAAASPCAVDDQMHCSIRTPPLEANSLKPPPMW